MALILIIDDSPFQRALMRDVAQAEGYKVVEARDGSEGLQMINSHTPDCILTDLLMPKMGGIELLKTINEKGCKIPAIVVTANIQRRVRKQCMELGAWGFIEKPINGDELKNTIIKVLETKEEI